MNDEVDSVRIDRWLWSVRIYKTRADATQSCKASAVRINDQPVKPSTKVRIGDIIKARRNNLTKTLLVTGLIEKRVGASKVSEYCKDQTPASELFEAQERSNRSKLHKGYLGKGRPTKKDRRTLKKFLDYEM